MIKQIMVILSLFISIVLFSGFWNQKNQQEIQQERVQRLDSSKKTLELLYKYAPSAKQMIEKSYGYATFSNVGVNLILLSAEGGSGIAKNNHTGKVVYMNMASGGIGFGLGVKDFRAIFIFETEDTFKNFVENGWEANAQADAAAKVENKGGAFNGAITIAEGIKLYKLTQNGLALQATIQGTKYFKDSELN